mmetsp:Transcript_4591/g.6285  ORF Transcript_4591/g.6285 Transcript_4591/m.6285 type:complete len:254 (-) Transcript_4591:399-1160(-)|eukprot:CAMPEP_0185723314 /NCGR_PEP_ID=MMETSP1171-20130828/195_1 /TAXON_ID=374046 /ORGANISM="Helicotheca tamensis, Strain CCMP826" /LENGTH=253 /DNA_ID=CAMNT_0028390995 /DNA_START=236 /DNA_END=997 /DNA_ORIENTATION=+
MTFSRSAILFLAAFPTAAIAYSTSTSFVRMSMTAGEEASSRRAFFSKAAAVTLGTATASGLSNTFGVGGGGPAEAVGPVKVTLQNPKYFAETCPPSKPIPGEKAMKGMKGLCVTVKADLAESPPKDLEKVGVYGFITDGVTGDSVLANNPDLSTDAGQFSMIESVTTKDKKVEFEFIAAIPREKDTTKFEDGIGPLNFDSLRIISYPGGQQYGAISPCEMNEFSSECEAWEEENGPYVKGDYMVKSNPRTKGR